MLQTKCNRAEEGEVTIDNAERTEDRAAVESTERRKKVMWPAKRSERQSREQAELIYTFGKELFGTAQEKVGQPKVGGNRRQQKISNLRGELRRLKSRFRQAEEEEKQGLAELRDGVRKEIQCLRRAEKLRRKRH
ncbi:hypothetical protein DPMN_113976 [Dreissena polymorpha]|uniref:Uncharacterized protein n=1 Tax=Dreissena polymorpha TaxID=45954 RepID=A0A9D4QR55_DREPO|nr:hypothetical protein DPMN_113976 [Dreissena polymorpha]